MKATKQIETVTKMVETTVEEPRYSIEGLTLDEARHLMAVLTQSVLWANSGKVGDMARAIYTALEARGVRPSRVVNYDTYGKLTTTWKELS